MVDLNRRRGFLRTTYLEDVALGWFLSIISTRLAHAHCPAYIAFTDDFFSLWSLKSIHLYSYKNISLHNLLEPYVPLRVLRLVEDRGGYYL